MWPLVIATGALLGPCLGIQVDMDGDWHCEMGWQISCSWSIPAGDRLQSVRLYRDDQQFMIYRPETHGLTKGEVFRNPEYFMKIDCAQNDRKSYDGACAVLIEPYQPFDDDVKIACEVSGERPLFRMVKKEFVAEAFVPPSRAVFTEVGTSRPPAVALNCTAAGLPPPSLRWTVGDEQKVIQADFSHKQWNATTKLWHVWSSLNYTPQLAHERRVNCTPVVTRGLRSATGAPAVYNASPGSFGCATALLAIQALLLVR